MSQIESNIILLPADEQLTLISRIAERLSRRPESPSEFEARMIEMASDPEIQREMEEIARDFRITEMDGLGK
ncbi:MAG: hypothetical protein ACKVQJ_08930 [Pyrinomonadaceae bacterium]